MLIQNQLKGEIVAKTRDILTNLEWTDGQ